MDGLPWFPSLLFRHPKATVNLGTHGLLGLASIKLDLNTFNSHLYVVGASGQGKSKFLQQLLFQLAVGGHGCGLFDPHTDLASDLLAELASYPNPAWLVDRQHQARVIFLDPSPNDYLTPFNLH